MKEWRRYWPRYLPPAIDRFEEKIMRVPIAGCWLWTAAADPHGYGRFSVNGRPMLAHRFAWEHFRGPVPAGKFVCHRCDVPACCNPDHMFIGDQKENMQDAAKKFRVGYGERHCHAKLTEQQVIEIKTSTESSRVLGKRFGVHEMHVNGIRRGEDWKHIK